MILITGGTGTSGVPIVNALLDRGAIPRVLARDPEKAAALLGEDVELARGDFNDEASLEAAMEDVDRALLLSPPAPDTVEVQNRFIDVAKRAGVKHIVKFSAFGAGTFPFTFGDWHSAVEKHLEQSGIAWTHLRPTFFMQNFLGMAGMIKSGTIYQPTGSGRAAFVDVRDIAAVAASALTESGHEGKTYDVTGPQSLSYADVAAIFSRVLDREIKFLDVTPDDAMKGMMQMGIPAPVADGINELSAAMKAGKFDCTTDVVTRVGKKKPIDLEEFILENVKMFM